MALNVPLWHDKQLDELADLLQTADYSAVADFIANNYLCQESGGLGRIMTDPSHTTLRVTVNGGNSKSVDISAGVFQFGAKVSQLDSTETVNILDSAVAAWGGVGAGKAADATLDRWSIICVKNTDKENTQDLRWFVDDSVDPNTYSKIEVNTLLNKAYYDIIVVHGTEGGDIPATPGGYWCIAEIFVPAASIAVDFGNIYDTGDISQATPKNWVELPGSISVPPTRCLRMEFWSTLFGIDHDPSTGYHRLGGWHIGSTEINVSGDELNQALDGIGAEVTAANLTKLTNGSNLAPGELHNHGNIVFVSPFVTLFNYAGPIGWTDIDISAYVPTGVRAVILDYGLYFVDGARTGSGTHMFGEFRGKGAPAGNEHVLRAMSLWTAAYGYTSLGTAYGQLIVEVDTNRIFQARVYNTVGAGATVSFFAKLVGYLQ